MNEYTKLSALLYEELSALVAGKSVCGSDISADFHTDESPYCPSFAPEAVVFPDSAEEVAAVLRFCTLHRIPVTPRGSGTGLVGGALPVHGGIVLSTEKMDRILELDSDNLLVRVEPGVRVGDLQKLCEEHNLFYPPDPAEKLGSVGGNISTNAGGMRAVKYGVTRDYVLSVKVALPDGTVTTFGRDTIKDSSGYSLLNLIVGSEGTLGVICEVTLRLIPLPSQRASLLFCFSSVRDALNAVPLLRRQVIPRSIEFMEYSIVHAVQLAEGVTVYPEAIDGQAVCAYLLVTFDGSDKDSLDSVLETVGSRLLDAGALEAILADNATDEKKLFSVREKLLETVKKRHTFVDELDLSLAPAKMADLIEHIWYIAEAAELSTEIFGHAGDGNLHIYLCADNCTEAQFDLRREKAMNDAYVYAISIGGNISGEHGIGLFKKSYLTRCSLPRSLNIMKGIKNVFDPENILNPGKIF